MCRRNKLHALQFFQATLGLLGLGRLGAKTADELVYFCDPPLLFLIACLLLGQAQRLLLLIGAVIATIALQLLLLDADDLIGDGIEKIPVVGDQQQSAGISLQPLLQPQGGIEVEVVGRLIEQQQFRRTHQGLRQVQANTPTPGKTANRIAYLCRCKAQAMQ